MYNKENKKKYNRTICGLITRIYSQQRSSSKKRGHHMPAYSKEELTIWISRQPLFNELYSKWVYSGYKTELKPSVDRVDSLFGYSLDNIQLMTWSNNFTKGIIERSGCKNGKSKLASHYECNSTTRYSFKRTCKNQGWHFEDFVEVKSLQICGHNCKYYYINKEDICFQRML